MSEKVNELLDEVIELSKGHEGATHWESCWKVHAGCLASLIQGLLSADPGPAVDEAKLAEVVRVEMSKGAYEIVRGEKPYESSARWVAHAVAEWLRGEQA